MINIGQNANKKRKKIEKRANKDLKTKRRNATGAIMNLKNRTMRLL